MSPPRGRDVVKWVNGNGKKKGHEIEAVLPRGVSDDQGNCEIDTTQMAYPLNLLLMGIITDV
jgi:hypothetical protein